MSLNQSNLSELPDLPRHESSKDSMGGRLTITGLVRNSRVVTFNEINGLPKTKLTEDFQCLEGWVVRDVLWEGVRVSDLFRLVPLDRAAQWVLFGSGEYTAVVSLRTALKGTTVLALKKSGKRLTRNQGGPYRLVFMGHQCYESIKCVDRVVALSEPVEGTARDIATARIRK